MKKGSDFDVTFIIAKGKGEVRPLPCTLTVGVQGIGRITPLPLAMKEMTSPFFANGR